MRGKVLGAVFTLALSLAMSGNALAQSVLTGSFPGNWGAAVPPPAVPLPGGSTGNVPAASINSGPFYDGAVPSYTLTLLGYEAKAVEDNVGATDSFRFRITQEQSFTMAEDGIAAIPMYTSGSITIGGPPFSSPPPSNFAFGEAITTATIYDATGAAKLTVTRHLTAFAPATGSVPLVSFFDYDKVALTPGTYRLRATLEIAGEGGSISSLPGASVNVDFFDNAASAQRQGLGVSLGTYKAGLGNSRAAVKAPEARALGAVDGTGVKVGVVEPGQSYTSHTSLAGITPVNPGAPPAGDYRDEHTLAVAGIIGANTGDATRTGDNGIAPGASLYSASSLMYGSTPAAISALIAKGVNVINMSASSSMTPAALDAVINGNTSLTFVKSSGNNGTAGGNTITTPGMAKNIITVGGVNRGFGSRAPYSSFSNGALPIKPDIVAPSEYINVPQSQDVDGDTLINDFGRIFLGDDFDKKGGATTGEVTGTSFSAPHVAGAAALMIQYAMDNATHHVQDHRAIKAILLNGASTGVTHNGGGAWTQARTGDGSAATPMSVTQSLDTELGTGLLDVLESMKQFKPDEIHDSHTNAAAHFVINTPLNTTIGGFPTPSGPIVNEGRFWDLEHIPGGGRVDYLLGDIQNGHVRNTLTWDDVGGTLQPLEMLLFHEGIDAGNVGGFDPANPLADILLASTSGPGENVKLFDFNLPIFGPSPNAGYYLEVINSGGSAADYGLAVSVPEPALVPEPAFALILVAAPVLIRRRR